jgi:Iap family predicted aminopeptidase
MNKLLIVSNLFQLAVLNYFEKFKRKFGNVIFEIDVRAKVTEYCYTSMRYGDYKKTIDSRHAHGSHWFFEG